MHVIAGFLKYIGVPFFRDHCATDPTMYCRGFGSQPDYAIARSLCRGFSCDIPRGMNGGGVIGAVNAMILDEYSHE